MLEKIRKIHKIKALLHEKKVLTNRVRKMTYAKKFFNFIAFFCCLFLCIQYWTPLNSCASEADKEQSREFMWGFGITWPAHLLQCDPSRTGTGKESEINKIKGAIDKTADVGGKWLRLHLVWKEIEPEILNKNVSSITPDPVQQYLKETENNWKKYDEIVNYARGKGVNIIFILGTGFNDFLPNYNGKTISVDWQTDIYRSRLALHVRAAVRRYSQLVHVWQLENELNTAGAQQIRPWKWRSGAKWADGWFCRSLLEVMRNAVKTEDAKAKVYANFHFLNPVAIPDWSQYLDIIGVNIYWDESLRLPKPDVKNHIDEARRLSGGKPILVSEIGYNGGPPRDAENRDMLEKKQADWLQESAEAAINSGAIGYLYWTISTPEKSLGHGDEYMGLIRSNCQPKKAYFKYKEIIGKYEKGFPTLNENIIKRLFQSRLNEAGSLYAINYIKWQEGAFTKKSALEAVVYFFDGNQPHVASGAELWLLQYGHNWNIIRKIAEADDISFRVVDVDKDGILEILIESSGGNQGYEVLQYEVVSLSYGSRYTLYLSRGFDNTSAEEEGEALCKHSIEFKDIDNDGILELIDVFERASYRWSGEKWKSKYIQTSSSVEKIVYKLRQGKFTRTGFKP